MQTQPKPVTPIDLSSLDYPELAEEKVSSPQCPSSPETGHVNSSLQHPALPMAGLQNVDGQLVNPKGSIEQDKSLPPPSLAPFRPTLNVPSSGPLSPLHTAGPTYKQPGFAPAVSSSQYDRKSSQTGSQQLDPRSMPSSQSSAPILQHSAPAPGVQSLMGITPQAIIPNPAGPSAAGSFLNTTAPHPSVQTGLQANTPSPAPQMALNTQPSSSPSATVPKVVLQPGVPFPSPLFKPSAQPGISPPQSTISQSTPSSNMSAPGVQHSSVNSTSSTSQVHSVAPLQVTPTISTVSSAAGRQLSSKLPVYSQGPGVAAPGQQSIQSGNQSQVPLMSQVSHGNTQIPRQSSPPAAQHHQAAASPIPRADPRKNPSRGETTFNSSQVSPPGHVVNSHQKPTQPGPSGSTKQPYGEQKASESSHQAVSNQATTYITTPCLPPGWERVASGGKVYYKDHNTHTTHWRPPSSGTTPAAPQSSVQKQQQSQSGPKAVAPQSTSVTGLPPGWQKVEREGKVYYKDHNTHTTHWQPPSSGTTPAAPQSSVQKQQQSQSGPKRRSIDRAKALQKSLVKRLVSLIFFIFMLHACALVEEGGGQTLLGRSRSG